MAVLNDSFSTAPLMGVSALYQSGQTFITWTEQADLSGEQYNVYRHTEPITAQNLGQAAGLYAVPEGSGRFYANRYNPIRRYMRRPAVSRCYRPAVMQRMKQYAVGRAMCL